MRNTGRIKAGKKGPAQNISKYNNVNRHRKNSIKHTLVVLVEVEAESRTKTYYRQGLP